MRKTIFVLPLLCAAMCTSSQITAQAINDNALKEVALSKLVFPGTFTTVAPTAFHLHGHEVLCYELYIINISEVPAELTRVQVVRADDKTVLQDKTGGDLAAAVSHLGRGQWAAKNAIAIGPGEQIIFFAWVDMPAGSTPPHSIRHVLTMSQKGGENLRIITRNSSVKQTSLQIDSPLRGSNWLAANAPSNTSGHRRTVIPLDGNIAVPQRFAIDWLMVDKSGKTYSGDRSKNESYFCYGQKVHAVADGVVTAFQDGIPQNVPGANSRAIPITLETIAGNHILVNIGDGFYALYAHLQPGSYNVKLGDHVKSGHVLGLLGNSGNSTEPHLHFHLIDHNSPLSGEGLPFTFRNYYLLGQKAAGGDVATPNWRGEPLAVRLEIPAENDLVEFSAEEK